MQGSLQNDPTRKLVSAFHCLYQEPSGYQGIKHEAACRSAEPRIFPCLAKIVVVDSSKYTEKSRDVVQLLVGNSTAGHRVRLHSLAHTSLLGRCQLLQRKAGAHADQLLNWKLDGLMNFALHLASVSWTNAQCFLLFNLFPAHSQKAHTWLIKFPVKCGVQHRVPADRQVSPMLAVEISKKGYSNAEDKVLLFFSFYDIFFPFYMS